MVPQLWVGRDLQITLLQPPTSSRHPGVFMGTLCLSVTQDLASTFGLDLLFLEGGFLRKSVSDFSLLSHGQRLRAAQVLPGQGLGAGGGGQQQPSGATAVPVSPLSLPVVLHLCAQRVVPQKNSQIYETRHCCSGEGSPLLPQNQRTQL